MALNTSTLRPGLLVSLKTSVAGNVQYTRRDLESDHITGVGMVARWETERTIIDPVEHEAASKTRIKAGSTIRSICAQSAFGLLCPEDASDRLNEAIRTAHRIVEEFNATATLSRIHLYVIVGRVAADDVEAVRAINSEVRDLLTDMESGLSNLDVKRVREAASKAKSIGNMLEPNSQARIQLAIEAARTAAKKIVAAGEQVAQEVDRATMRRLAEVRTAFLDLDEVGEVAAPAVPARVVDFEPMLPMGTVASRAGGERKKKGA